MLREPPQEFDEHAPDVLDGGELDALAGGVRLYNTRANAGHLDARIVLYEESGLEHEVHGYHAGAPAQHVEEGVGGELQEW